ncbi:hypothetical protein DSCOOX_62780 [Desulfosarcina ovata subsp. ovata]|uniref:Uncharacterized protein n=1 Tax=Desulfosarcina ovata subsp. ovata TaxID=2752305 RepID=A0A5K8AKH4_9BACT|nr:hypothetical protein DSCOOX_62780 [Desulfosarcina ovata subsp. ovata]
MERLDTEENMEPEENLSRSWDSSRLERWRQYSVNAGAGMAAAGAVKRSGLRHFQSGRFDAGSAK